MYLQGVREIFDTLHSYVKKVKGIEIKLPTDNRSANVIGP